MKKSLQIFILFAFCSITHSADKHVLQLTDAKFPKQIKAHMDLLIMFFIPWSGPCQKLRPHFAQAAEILKNNEVPVTLGKMDCSNAGRITCENKQLRHHFPVIHLYKNGTFIKEYTGSKDTLSLVKFMRVQASPNITELKSVEEFKNFIRKQDDVVVVGFFEEESSKLQRMFMKVYNEMKEMIIFAFTTCEKLILKEGVYNGIALYRPEALLSKYEEEKALFTGRVVIGEIKNFIIRSYHGLVGHRNYVNRADFQNPLIILYYHVDDHSDAKEGTYWRNRVLKVAHKYKDFVKFAVSARDEFEEELSVFNIDYTDAMKPFVLGIDLENQKYVMSDNFTTETFENFVHNFVKRRLAPYIKSKSISSEYDGDVIVAVAKNFQKLVMNNNKDIFLDLYTPWTGKYQKFLPVLREVADLLHEEDVDVIKFDTTENEIPEIFADKPIPNSYWLPNGKKKEPVLYNGGKTVEEVMKFIARRATKELLHYDRLGNPKQEQREEL